MKLIKHTLMILSVAALAATLGACSKSDFSDENANYNRELLKFIPADARMVVVGNPAMAIASGGGQWTAEGVDLGKEFEDLAAAFGMSDETHKRLEQILEIKGLNHASTVSFLSDKSAWYGLMAISDYGQLSSYLKSNLSFKSKEYDGLEVWTPDADGNGSMVCDKEQSLMWICGETGAAAARRVKLITKSAGDKALPEWLARKLTADNTMAACMFNFAESGINLAGVAPYIGLSGDFFGENVDYIFAAYTETNHHGTFTIDFTDSQGAPSDFINPAIGQGGNFSAVSKLPDGCSSGVGIALSYDQVSKFVPALISFNEEFSVFAPSLKAINSVAFGCLPFDINAFQAGQILPEIALIVKSDTEATTEMIGFLKEMLPPDITSWAGDAAVVTIPAGVLNENIGKVEIRVANDGDCLTISTIPEFKLGNSSHLKTDLTDAMIASYTLQGAYGPQVDDVIASYCTVTARGITSTIQYKGDCPGLLSVLYKSLASIARQQQSGLDID